MSAVVFVGWIFFLGVMLLVAYVQWRKRQPRVLLGEIPSEVRLGDRRESVAARDFWEHFDQFFADFEQRAHPYQYRQMIDLMACGPRHLALACVERFVTSAQIGVYASDVELRNELAEITVHLLRDADSRDERDRLIALLDRLADFSGRHARAFDVWFEPLMRDCLGTDRRRRAHAVYCVAKLGPPELRAELQAILATQSSADDDYGALLAGEWSAAHGERPLETLPPLPPPGHPLPNFADYEGADASTDSPPEPR